MAQIKNSKTNKIKGDAFMKRNEENVSCLSPNRKPMGFTLIELLVVSSKSSMLINIA